MFFLLLDPSFTLRMTKGVIDPSLLSTASRLYSDDKWSYSYFSGTQDDGGKRMLGLEDLMT